MCKSDVNSPEIFSLWGTNGPENDLRGSACGDVLFVNFAVDFIESQLDESQPLFLYLALHRWPMPRGRCQTRMSTSSSAGFKRWERAI